MNDVIVKAYDIVIEQQRNADAKANLFIVLITAFLSYLGSLETKFQTTNFENIIFLLWLLIIPLVLLILSLLPVYRSSYKFYKKRKKPNNFNIFYWESIAEVESNERFIEIYKTQYNHTKLEESERNLLIQLRTNSNILCRKTFLHKIAFYILGQILIFFVLSLIYTFIKHILILIIVLFIFEVLYYLFLFGKK